MVFLPGKPKVILDDGFLQGHDCSPIRAAVAGVVILAAVGTEAVELVGNDVGGRLDVLRTHGVLERLNGGGHHQAAPRSDSRKSRGLVRISLLPRNLTESSLLAFSNS
ncbi:MAG: hypothetical protein EPN26_10355 [Rhodospirillales bacterium]|nr:MAG: hypothetical protein EPN26_10355 [Rhodospirillales bacterium]